MLQELKHFVGSFFSEQTRENLILFFKSKGTRENLLRKLKINKFTKKNCYYISADKQPEEISKSRVAIHFHIFYTDLLDEIYSHLKDISLKYDLYISTSDDNKKSEIQQYLDSHTLKANKIVIETVENRGRDIWPFMKMIHPVWKQYDYIAHLHTKKSVTQGERGNCWRKYLYDNILGTGYYFNNLISLMDAKPEIGMLAPPPFPDDALIYAYSTRGSNQCVKNLNNFFKKLNSNLYCKNAMKYQYSPGNMFVAKSDSIKQILDYEFKLEDFPVEKNQQSDTLQHTMEQCWHFYIKANNYKYKECFKR